MRYLLHKSQQNELTARQDYLYDIFHLFFISGKPEGGYIPLYPVGSIGPNILFITGHYTDVYPYLKIRLHQVPEDIVVITSCFGSSFKRLAKKTHKQLYVPTLDQSLCYFRDGNPFGFDFKITDAELNFYNGRGDIMDRLTSTYKRLR